jgi:superfamily I DNA/RNA helicase
MKTLGTVTPTSEQLILIDNPAPGFWLVAGAAGSGKTTTALLRLKFLVRYWRERRADLGLDNPVRVLVLTFNRTLRGYIAELAEQQIPGGAGVEIEVSTFGYWSQHLLGGRVLLEAGPQQEALRSFAGTAFGWPDEFLASEINYVLGRFMPDDRQRYVQIDRTGRGRSPQVERGDVRSRLIDQVIEPYAAWKSERGVVDWNDLAVELARTRHGEPYDIVVVDEAQDFSANQVRAVVNHLAHEFVCTFVRDTTQRIYPNAFVWRDVNVKILAAQSKKLKINYRNTKEIAAFARPLVDGIEVVEDGTLPDFTGCIRESGELPVVLRGKFSKQLNWAIEYLQSGALRADQTVAFLHPKGGGWFRAVRERLDAEGMDYSSLTRETDWPTGPEQIALSTMHSAKGLEFDHVILLGYNAEVVAHGAEDGDVMLDTHRRLLAMAVGRARQQVIVGYKPSDRSRLVDFLKDGTYVSYDV